MQALHMISVVPEGRKYAPCHGKCTIRKSDGKYQGLTPGDNILMHHTVDKDSRGPSLATEILTISSVAMGSFEVIFKAHAKNSHTGMTSALLRSFIKSQYPNMKEDDTFIAIYF